MRITTLTMAAPHPDELKKFYSDMLGFEEIPAMSDSDGYSFQAGYTRVNFIPGDRDARYHFAFNVNPDRLPDAIEWLQSKGAELIHSKEHKGFVIDFPGWWAKSVYFFDPAGNIVEVIARGGIGPAGNAAKFDPKSLKGVSEIGIVTDDVASMREWIATTHGIQEFSRNKNSDDFTAMGDDHGLLLLVNTGRRWFIGGFDAVHYPLAIDGDNQGREFRLLLP